jgi:transposase
MMQFSETTCVLVAIEPIDFRSGINRLVSKAFERFQKHVEATESVFVFRNKRGTDIKLIWFDVNGYFMAHKRLSKDKLTWWPRSLRECQSLSPRQLLELLRGHDPREILHTPHQQPASHGRNYTPYIESEVLEG